jgi:hypothetical protein
LDGDNRSVAVWTAGDASWVEDMTEQGKKAFSTRSCSGLHGNMPILITDKLEKPRNRGGI